MGRTPDLRVGSEGVDLHGPTLCTTPKGSHTLAAGRLPETRGIRRHTIRTPKGGQNSVVASTELAVTAPLWDCGVITEWTLPTKQGQNREEHEGDESQYPDCRK